LNTVSIPVREPLMVGANWTAIVHDPPAPSDDGHVFVWVKSPVIAMLAIESGLD
jgi:hypothetical protein